VNLQTESSRKGLVTLQSPTATILCTFQIAIAEGLVGTRLGCALESEIAAVRYRIDIIWEGSHSSRRGNGT
jgi:hypothetical protein